MGPAKSFLDLVYNAPLKYDYYAFCDQDDYWKEDKLYKAIERLEHFDDKPALYHCELEIVDENPNWLTIIKLLLLDLFVKTLVSNSNRIIGSHIFGAIVTLCVAFRTEQNRL